MKNIGVVSLNSALSASLRDFRFCPTPRPGCRGEGCPGGRSNLSQGLLLNWLTIKESVYFLFCPCTKTVVFQKSPVLGACNGLAGWKGA